MVNLSKPIELLSFIGDKIQSFDFEIRDEDVIFEKHRLIYSEIVHRGLEELNKREIPYSGNQLIELKRKLIETHTRIILKYNNYYFKKSEEIARKRIEEIEKEYKK